MARVGLLVPGWTGHINPATALGCELQRRGHHVSVISFLDAQQTIASAGLGFVPFGQSAFARGEWNRMSVALSQRAGGRAAVFTIQWLSRMTRVVLAELPEVLRREKLDGLVADQIFYGAEEVADVTGMPLVVACHALPLHMQPDIPPHAVPWAWRPDWVGRLRNRAAQHAVRLLALPMIAQVRRHRRARGLSLDVWTHYNEIPPSLAHVTQLPACLDFDRQHAPDHFHHTGPWHVPGQAGADGFQWDRLDGRPLIYASIGTLQNRLLRVLQILLDAVAGLRAQVVLALGRNDGPVPERVPANTLVCGYAPQLALVRRASLVVTHAGLNTTLESLAAGVPLVALPITNDQPAIGARIRHTGVGEVMSCMRVTPAGLRRAIEHVLDEPRYRARAQELAQQIQRADGLRRAASIMEDAFLNRRRVRAADYPQPPSDPQGIAGAAMQPRNPPASRRVA
jgi:zeaxanthin glucosyltransferase